MLDEYIKIHNAHPAEMTDEEWIDIIKKMSRTLKNADESTTEFTNPYEEAYLKTLEFNIENGQLECHADKDLDEKYHSYEREKDAFMEKSLDEGLALFRKYFRKLWD